MFLWKWCNEIIIKKYTFNLHFLKTDSKFFKLYQKYLSIEEKLEDIAKQKGKKFKSLLILCCIPS